MTLAPYSRHVRSFVWVHIFFRAFPSHNTKRTALGKFIKGLAPVRWVSVEFEGIVNISHFSRISINSSHMSGTLDLSVLISSIKLLKSSL